MTTSTKARAARHLKRMAAVGAVALLLGRATASPAEAMPRSHPVDRVDRATWACLRSGGEPVVVAYGGSFAVGGAYETGDYGAVADVSKPSPGGGGLPAATAG